MSEKRSFVRFLIYVFAPIALILVGAGPAKPEAKAKPKGKAQAAAGAAERAKVATCRKYCRACHKTPDVSVCPPGSALCGEDTQAAANLRNAVRSQGHERWIEGHMATPTGVRRLVTQ